MGVFQDLVQIREEQCSVLILHATMCV